jgi:AcrR family transcriptional regulator
MDIKSEQNMEQAILETAERLFLEKGFAATSTTQIAKAVGCNQALVHYYFRTKENLFNTIFEHKFKLFFQGVFDVKNTVGKSFEEKIRYIIESHFDMLQQNPKMPFLIVSELSRQPDQLKMLRDKLHTLPEQLFMELNEELQREIASGRIREISLIDIIVSAISLNVSLFIMMPVAEKILQFTDEQREFMIAHRRAENVDFVLKSLRP